MHLFEQFGHRRGVVHDLDVVVRLEEIRHEVRDLGVVVHDENRGAVLVEAILVPHLLAHGKPVPGEARHRGQAVVGAGCRVGGLREVELREAHGEGRQVVGRAFHGDVAAHAQGRAVADRQAQVALEGEAPLALALEVVEDAVAVENRLNILEVDPYAVVCDDDEQLAAVAADREPDGAVVGRMLEGIRQQGVENRRDSVAVGGPHQVGFDVDLAADAVAVGIVGEGLGDAAPEFRHRDQFDIFRMIRLADIDPEFAEHVDQVVEPGDVLADRLGVAADISVGPRMGEDLLAGPRDHRQGHGQLLGDVRHEAHFRVVDLFAAAYFELLLAFRSLAAVSHQVVADRAADSQQDNEYVEYLREGGGVPCRADAYRERVDGAVLSGDVVVVADVEFVVSRREVGEREASRTCDPLLVEPGQLAEIGVVAAVDVVECRDRESEDALVVAQGQHAPAREQALDAEYLVGDADVAELYGRREGGFLVGGLLDGDDSVRATEKEGSVRGVVVTGSVAVFDGVQPVGVSVYDRIVGLRGVADQSAVCAEPEIVFFVLEDSVDGAVRGADRRVALQGYEPAAGSEPYVPVPGAVDGVDVVGDGVAPVVELEHLALAGPQVVAYGAPSAVSEPHQVVSLRVEREEEVLDLQFIVEMQAFDGPDLRPGVVSREFDPVDPAPDRGDPQRRGVGFVQSVNVFQCPGDGRLDPVYGVVAVGVVVQPVAVASDPQHVAVAVRKGVDRIVEQRAVCRGDLPGVLPVELLLAVEVADAEDPFALCPDPEGPFVVDNQGACGFREAVGEAVVGDRAERHVVARLLEEPLSVASDPYDLLPGVPEQREDASLDVDRLDDVPLPRLGRPLQAEGPVGIERDEVVVAVANDARDVSADGKFLLEFHDVAEPRFGGLDLEKRLPGVDQADALPVGEGAQDRGFVAQDVALPEFGRSVLLECDGDAVHALAGADPEVAVGVEEHGQRIVVPDAVGEPDADELPDEGVVAPGAAVLCQDEDFAARAARNLVHSLKLRMPFDALVRRVEEVEPVVRADPEERIARDGDLFDQVSREPVVLLPGVREELHPLAVPHVQPVACPDPEESVLVLPERQHGVVGDSLEA